MLKSIEVPIEIKNVFIQALKEAYSKHEALDISGEELVQKNRFGETALKVDIEIEEVIINVLKENLIPIRIISEEHGVVDITPSPKYLGILDGLDGSGVYKKSRGVGRYGTMFAIYDSLDPTYDDYLISGAMEHTTGRMYIAVKGEGLSIEKDGKIIKAKSSGKTILDKTINIRIDEYTEMNKKVFSEKLKDFDIQWNGSSCISYVDVASGVADLALECTRKNNLEIAVAYGLETEAGAVIVDINGNSLGNKKYLSFGQDEQVSVITAATRDLAIQLISYLKSVG